MKPASCLPLTRWWLLLAAIGLLSPGPAVRSESTESNRHWAFQLVRETMPPVVQNRAWERTPVDRFILASLEGMALRPAHPADRRTLIRRAAFDLTGLPPAPDEAATFVGEPAPTEVAFAHVVERFLASPRSGECWARPDCH